MDDKLGKAMDEFITQRLGDLGRDSPISVTEAIANLSRCLERLATVLPEEQREYWIELENALSLQAGEETRYYYKSGFDDALHFLLEWGGL